MISLLQPLAAGNAVRVFIVPPAGAEVVRVLRRTADTFTGADDSGAYRVASDSLDDVLLDITGLVNGQTYFYRAYAFVGGVWVQSGASDSVQVAATYRDDSVDVIGLVRDRLAAGLTVEVQRGALVHELGKIPVLLAAPTFEGTKWPVVTVHLASDTPDTRFVGEQVQADWYDAASDEWLETEGWLSRVRLTIIGWTINADGRSDLRKSIRRVLQTNLPVFDDQGMYQIGFDFSDTEDFTSYNAPVFQTICQFNCLARNAVSAAFDPIRHVVVTSVEPAPS